MKRKLLFVANGLGMGGAEKMLVLLANHFSETGATCDIACLSSADALRPELALPISVYLFPRNSKLDFSPAEKIAQLLRANQYDVVFPFSLYAFFFYNLASYRCKNIRPRTFISIHSTTMPFKQYLFHWVYTRFLTPAETIIAVCKKQAHFWHRVYGIPLERMKVVYNGVDTARFDPAEFRAARAGLVRTLGIPEDAQAIVSVANLSAYKRQEDEIEALSVLREKFPNSFLILVGSGTAARIDSLRRLAVKRGVLEHVRFAGMQIDVRPFLAGSDIFTLASTSETFSVAALEAMAMGLPCVLTDIGGAREMITPQNGLLVRPARPRELAAAWAKILENRPAYAAQDIRRYIVENFSIEKVKQAYTAILLQP